MTKKTTIKKHKSVRDIFINGTPEERRYLCRQHIGYFGIYYFSEFYKYEIADYQKDMYDDLHDLLDGDINELLWIMYRESAKTSIAKIFATYCICYRLKRFINYDAFDKDNSEAALFDISVWLQTNQKIIADFGQLYFEDNRDPKGKRRSEMKRMTEFITANDIKVKAYSTQQSTRGRIYKEQRPDLYILDDFETSKTKDSAASTAKVKKHIDEMRSGLSTDGRVIYLGNRITDIGTVAYLESITARDPMMRLREVPVVDRQGTVMWPDKYVKTDKEAAQINKTIEDPQLKKVSLESKKRALGDRVYATEMENDPGQSGDYVFDRKKIKRLLEHSEEPKKTVAGLKIWDEFKASHRYGGGGDTSEGIGQDANTLAIIDFTSKPALLVATFKDNRIAPNTFGHEINRAGLLYGEPIMGVEINNTGYATIAELQTIEYPNIYQRERKDRITNKMVKEYGWKTTSLTKPDIISQLVTAVEDGELLILDKELLDEMMLLTKQFMRQEASTNMTKHFDLVMAAAIAWEMRGHAAPSQTERQKRKKTSQKPYDQNQGMGT